MFIGRLTKYYEFMKEIEEVLEKFNPQMKLENNDPQSELYIEP